MHCWHTEDMFSKFQFGYGKYDGMDFTDRASMSSVRDYVALTAVSSIRLSDEDLRKLASNDSYASLKENWMRPKPSKVFDIV